MINSIVGLMNSGKTLYMVRQMFLAFLKGKEVLTNINLTFPHKKINKDFMLYLAKEQPILDNVCFGLDELWIWFDSYGSHQNKLDKTISYFFNQSSKDDTEIYLTSQHNKQLPKRLRDNLHKITQCSRVVLLDGIFHPIDDEERFLPPEFQDVLYIKMVEFKRVNFGVYTELMPQPPIYIKANIYFKLYDTTQKIKREAE